MAKTFEEHYADVVAFMAAEAEKPENQTPQRQAACKALREAMDLADISVEQVYRKMAELRMKREAYEEAQKNHG